MKNFLIALVVCVAVFNVVVSAQEPEGKTYVLTEKNNNTNLTISATDKIQINLQGNPTTGHRWNLYSLYGEAIIEEKKPEYHKNGHGHGGGGVFQFFYKAAYRGISFVKLVEGRSWESTPVDSFQIFVRVN